MSEPRAIDSSVGSDGARRKLTLRDGGVLAQRGDAAERDGLQLGGSALR